MKELYLTKGGEKMAETANGISVSGSGKLCTIEYDTGRYAPGTVLVQDAERLLADTGLDVKLNADFGSGMLTLVINEMKSVGYAVFNIIMYIVERIKASVLAPTT